MAELSERLAKAIDPEEVADLTLALASIESPPGGEGGVADAVADWLSEQGFQPRRYALLEHRPTIGARLHGRTDGPVLVFNAHMDTAISRADTLTYRNPADPKYVSCWREGNTLFGNGVVNDKAPLAAFLVAVATLKREKVEMGGDVLVSAVPGEIGVEPVDEIQGPNVLSKDIGTRFAIAHGLVGDGAIVAEATGYGLGWVEAGKAFVKVTVFGTEPRYTPFTPARADAATHPNAIVRMARAIDVLTEWIGVYSERSYDCEGGTVQARANIGAVRSGHPEKILKSPELASLYLDIRTLPHDNPLEIVRELRSVLAAAAIDAEVELFLHRRGWEAEGIAPLRDAVTEAHRAEFGSDPVKPDPGVTSMWRDTTPFIEAGIPSLMYGPSSSTGGGNFSISLDDLMAASRVYLRSALQYCGVVGEIEGIRPTGAGRAR